MRGLKGKNVLVTGGTSGIGQAIAVRFAEHGAHVAINYLKTPDEAAETEAQVHACTARVREAGVRDVLVGADVSDEAEVVRMVAETVDKLGSIDVLVNNAGIQISRPSAELSSVHQRIPKPDYLGYSVSKGGMQNLTTTLALEFAGKGIRVNAIGPGATITPINKAWVDDPEKAKQVYAHIPMSRAGTADEMAGVACFLASDDAAYITGQTIFVDGGLTLYPDFREPWSSE
jgi:glucose 1-dehydrogenase